MVDVFEQVEEELRSERYKRLARKWLPVVGAVLAVALVAALSWWGWDSYQTSRADKASVAYARGLQALQTNDTTAAEAAFAEAEKAGNGAYKALALQQRAGLAVMAGETTEAVALFDQAAKATRDPLLGDLSNYKASLILMDSATLEDLQARLEPLAKEGRPLRPFAQHALAMASLQHGKTSEARSAFVLLTLGQDVPDVIRQFAQNGIEAIDSGIAGNLGQISERMAQLPQPQAAPVGLGQSMGPQGPGTAPAQ